MSAPHRDPGLAATERVVQLEDELRALKNPQASKTIPAARPRRWRVWVAAALALGCGIGATWWLGKPDAQTVMRTNAGLSFTVLFRTPVTDVAFETTRGAPLVQLGPGFGGVDPEAHERVSVRGANVLLKDSQLATQGRTEVRVRYLQWGLLPRSAVLRFDAVADGNAWMKGVLEGLPPWVAFRDYDGKTLVYFTTLLAYKPTLQDVFWGLDEEPLAHRLRFTRSQALGIASDDEMFVTVPAATRQMRVQLTFRDGTKSEVRTMLRSDSTIP